MSRNLRQLICIDLDGPVLDVSERYYRVYSDTLKLIGFKPLNKESYWDLKRSKVSETEIIAQSGTPDNDLTRNYLDIRAKRIECAEYLLFDQVWPGTLDTLKAVRSRQALALVTMRNSTELLALQLERLKLHDAFDCVLAAGAGLVANDRGEQKAQLVRDYYGNEDFMGWFVGDSEADIQSGRLLGLRTAAITFGIRTVDHLSAVLPDVLLHSPADFQSWARNIDLANV
jgi:phosphoglycolate phosphatase-like HAD superfamily hydrolase